MTLRALGRKLPQFADPTGTFHVSLGSFMFLAGRFQVQLPWPWREIANVGVQAIRRND